MRRLCAGVAVLLVAACGESAEPTRDEPVAFQLATYPFERKGFGGAAHRLRAVDPATLRPLEPGLRLGGNVSTRALSPDRTRAAFGLEFGELVIVDLARRRIDVRFELGPPWMSVAVVAWPREDVLFAIACAYPPKSYCPNHLLVTIDPKLGRVRSKMELGADASTWRRDVRGRRAVLMLTPSATKGATRVVVVGPEPNVRQVTLTKIPTGQEPHRPPWLWHHRGDLAVDQERGIAVVVGPVGPIAEVRLEDLSVRYHPWRGARFDVGGARWSEPVPATGTSNPRSTSQRRMHRIDRKRLLVEATEVRVVGRSDRTNASLAPLVLDTRTWRAHPATPAERRAPWEQEAPGFPVRGEIVARFGRYVYTSRLPSGRITRVYDRRTGRLVRRVDPTYVKPDFTWVPPR